jgi:hypothetical protein
VGTPWRPRRDVATPWLPSGAVAGFHDCSDGKKLTKEREREREREREK